MLSLVICIPLKDSLCLPSRWCWPHRPPTFTHLRPSFPRWILVSAKGCSNGSNKLDIKTATQPFLPVNQHRRAPQDWREDRCYSAGNWAAATEAGPRKGMSVIRAILWDDTSISMGLEWVEAPPAELLVKWSRSLMNKGVGHPTDQKPEPTEALARSSGGMWNDSRRRQLGRPTTTTWFTAEMKILTKTPPLFWYEKTCMYINQFMFHLPFYRHLIANLISYLSTEVTKY